MNNSRAVAALSSLAAAGAVAAAGLSVPARPVAADAPQGGLVQSKALYAEKCSACHNLPAPEEKGYTRMEWQRTVNTMLTKYHASDEIKPGEAAQIVDYLATFAPKTSAAGPRRGGDPWATDGVDVWTTAPSAARVFNFESGGLAGLSPLGAGSPGPAPVWSVRPDRAGADGQVVRAAGPNFRADRFAVLLDRADGGGGRNVDVRVRFRIDAGKVSPAAGIAFGYADPSHYLVLRCRADSDDLALIQVSGAAHTTLQQTPLVLPAPGTPAPAAPPPAAATALAPGWHTLRLLVSGGAVHGWVDMQKRISTTLPAYAGGKVGLWTQGNTVASFDDWTVDYYDAPAAPPAPLS